jgi:hypothetical protein
MLDLDVMVAPETRDEWACDGNLAIAATPEAAAWCPEARAAGEAGGVGGRMA